MITDNGMTKERNTFFKGFPTIGLNIHLCSVTIIALKKILVNSNIIKAGIEYSISAFYVFKIKYILLLQQKLHLFVISLYQMLQYNEQVI